jgi:hypothetical protein
LLKKLSISSLTTESADMDMLGILRVRAHEALIGALVDSANSKHNLRRREKPKII